MRNVQFGTEAVLESKKMRFIRPILLGIILAGAFYFLTTHRPGAWRPSGISGWFGGNKLELTEAAQGNNELTPDEQTNIAVYKKVLPSVVNITSKVQTFNFFYGIMPQEGQGTGFIIDKQGHILTNYHVVQSRSAQLQVVLYNKKRYPAKLIGWDARHDLAVIKIEAPDPTPVVLGESRGLQVGQAVYAIGNPFGLNGTMTKGIVSAIRPIQSPNGNRIDDAIQTDAAINPGNSGGPLLNSHGQVIGINSMILTGGQGVEQNAGVGFAIPIDTAKAILNDLITRGYVARPYLGIRAALPIGPELANEMGLPADYGVLIIDLSSGSPAQKAGLQGGSQPALLGNTPIKLGGDLIVAIDGQDVQDLSDISAIMNAHKAGDTVTVTVYRGKKKMNFNVKLGEAPEG